MIEIKNNAVIRDGKHIGSIRDGRCFSNEKIAPAIKGQIKKAASNEALTFEIGGLDPVNGAENLPSSAPEAAKGPTALFGMDRLNVLITAGKLQQHPPTRPDMGDKTPAFVEWYRAHATPEEFEARYARRILPQSIAQVDAELAQKERSKKADGKFSV